jgi:hypothetical protein
MSRRFDRCCKGWRARSVAFFDCKTQQYRTFALHLWGLQPCSAQPVACSFAACNLTACSLQPCSLLPRNLQPCSQLPCSPQLAPLHAPDLTPTILQPCSLQPCSCSLRLLRPGSAALAGGLEILCRRNGYLRKTRYENEANRRVWDAI